MLRSASVVLSVVLCIFVNSGCSTYTKMVDSTKTAVKSAAGVVVSAAELVRIKGRSDDRFIKKIGIADLENTVGGSDPEIQNIFQKKLEDDLKSECGGIQLVNIGNFNAYFGYEKEKDFLLSNDTKKENPFQFVEKSRTSGFSAVVTGTILSISRDKKSSGMLWFKKKKYFLEMSAVGIVYDVETGVKLTEELYEQDFQIDESQYEKLNSNRAVGVDELMEALSEITESFSEDICEKIDSQPFKAYIVENDGKTVVLSSGKSSGIKKGDVMDVFDKGDVIEGTDNINYTIPGKKAAEIKITEVSDDTALGEFITGKVDTVFNVVIPKD